MTPEHPSADFDLMPDLVCGQSYRNQDSEARAVAMRCGEDTPYTGCGKPMRWVYGYRCRQCGRWMHGPCMDQHFGEHERALAASEARVRELEAATRSFVEHHDNGQAGHPGYPRTYGELDVWQSEWDRRYAAMSAALAGAGPGEPDAAQDAGVLAAADKTWRLQYRGRTYTVLDLMLLIAGVDDLGKRWDALTDCVNEFEPEDMQACGERRDDLDTAITQLLAAYRAVRGQEADHADD